MQAGGLILAGGKNTRMEGRYKGDLIYGHQTLLERLIREFQKETDEIMLSYGDKDRGGRDGCQIVMDQYTGCGPIGGIHAGLKRCQSRNMMVAACDMPFLEIQLYRFLAFEWERANQGRKRKFQGVVPQAERMIHPLAAIYGKEMETLLEDQIQKGNYRLTAALARADILYVDLTDHEILRPMLHNINTIEEYNKLKE